MGINARNARCILPHNPRGRIPIVDDKLQMAELCTRIGVPTPQIYGIVANRTDLGSLREILFGRDEFVVKPASGAGGRGILVITKRIADRFQKSNGMWIDHHDLRIHIADALTGMFSLSGLPDRVLIQRRIRPHNAFESIAPRGLPDIRVVLYRFEPVMAMLRLPTLASNGRANLHQGGIGVGVDLTSGQTHHAKLRNRSIECHPDTGQPVIGWTIPDWGNVLAMACRTARGVGLGFVGIDIVIDRSEGPLVLEANARPGLAIQVANDKGMRKVIECIDARFDVAKSN